MQDNPVRILIIDDNPADVGLLKEALLEECPVCEITHLDNGERAIDYLLRRGGYAERPIPELIILDLNMPKLDGHEVLKTVQFTPELSGIAVTILSSSPHEMARAALLHPSRLFQKPFDLDAFLAVARDILRQYRVSKAAGAGDRAT
jgi:two-component system, chemotaxis family, response regulator Rcp1